MNNMETIGAVLNLKRAVLCSEELDCMDSLWRREGILKPSQRLKYLPCHCGGDHEGKVEETPDTWTGTVRYFMRCTDSGELYPLSEEAAVGWKFDGKSMADMLRRILPCRGNTSIMIPGLLWYIGSCDTPVGGRRRDIYFALGINTMERAESVHEALPQTSTFLLFVGASRVHPGIFSEDRIFRLQDVLEICNGVWKLDFARMEERLAGPRETAAARSPIHSHAAGRGGETLARATEELGRWIRAEYDRYISNRRAGREYRLHAPTMTALAQAIGVNKSTISDLLNENLHGRDPRYMAVRELWATAHDMGRILRRLHRTTAC